MPDSIDSEVSRTDMDFGWVSDLPSYAGLLPLSTSSLLPKFSLFSLFRTARPTFPNAEQLGPLYSLFLQPNRSFTIKETINSLSALSDYVSLLQVTCGALKDDQAEEAEQWVLRAMEGYLIAASLVSQATFDASDVDSKDLGLTMSQSLRGLFTIHAHYVGSSRPAITTWLNKISANLLASPHIEIRSNNTQNCLVPLFAQTREIIRHLQHAARAVHSKPLNEPRHDPPTDGWDFIAGERMEWLRLFADHVRGLDGLKAMISTQDQGMGKRITKKALVEAEKEDRERPMRIAIEADLLRCDLAISMATSQIAEVKRRARVQYTTPMDDGRDVKPEIMEEVEVPASRKRRALTDESDLETVVPEQAEWEPRTITTNDAGGRRWEEDVDMVLYETLTKITTILEEKHSEVLVARIDRSDWLDDPASAQRQSLSPGKNRIGASETGDSSSEDESSSPEISDSDTSDDDLSHSCPLRTLFRLHDRYEEQRLAVWLSLPSAGRGKMGSFMRGIEGRVGQAWDAVGLRLLKEFDSDVLEGYGLSPDKHNKWVDLASRRGTKKMRKKGRKTV